MAVRAATASIRGYLHQTLLAAQAWLELEPGAILVVEGDEDFDTILRGGEQRSVQVKHRAREVSLNDLSDALKAFAATFAARGGQKIKFLYASTEIRRLPSRGPDILGDWAKPEKRHDVAAAVAALAAKHDWQIAWSSAPDWASFVAAVDFRFEQNHLEQARAELERRVAKDPRTKKLSRVHFASRLIDNLLTASTKNDRDLRRRTAEDLAELARTTAADLEAWAATEEAGCLVRWLDAVRELESLLDDGTRQLEGPQPSQILVASREVIPFLEPARQDELDSFAAWCRDPAKSAARRVVGAGGAGKTRFFIELCRRLRAQGWHAGFLRSGRDQARLDALEQADGPWFLVIDYAESRREAARNALLAVANARVKGRVVLVAREDGPWVGDLAKTEDQAQLLKEPALKLKDLSSKERPAERALFFEAMVKAFAAARGADPPQPLPAVDLEHESLKLALMLALAAHEASFGKAVVGDYELLEATLEHEKRFWRRFLEDQGVPLAAGRTVQAAHRVLANLTLRGRAGSREVAEAWIEKTTRDLAAANASALIENHYGWDSGLQPDILGEHLVMRMLEDLAADAARWLGAALDGAESAELETAFTVLGRLGIRLEQPSPDGTDRRRVEGWMKAILEVDLTGRALPAFAAALKLGYRTALASVADVLAERVEANPAEAESFAGFVLAMLDRSNITLVSLRRLAVACSQVSRKSVGSVDEAEQARRLSNRGYRLSDLGRLEEALDATSEAVEAFRGLAAARPDAFWPDLATSLNNLGGDLSALGRQEEALEATSEAVEIYRDLAAARPDAFLPTLAISLNNLGSDLSALGRQEEALDATDEGLRLILPLARRLPAAFESRTQILARNYLKRTAAVGVEPDPALLGAVAETYGSGE